MHVHTSKFVLFLIIPMSVALVTGTGFLIWLTYQLSIHHSLSLSLMLILFPSSILLVIVSVIACRRGLRMLLWSGKAVISFGKNSVSYTGNYRDIVETKYEQICGVELDGQVTPQGSIFYLKIKKTDSTVDRIPVGSLDISIKKIFAEFKSRLPFLVQPNMYDLCLKKNER